MTGMSPQKGREGDPGIVLGSLTGHEGWGEGLLCVVSFNLDSDNHPILQLGKLRLREGEGPAQGHTARRPLGSEGLSLAPGPFVVLLPSPAARCTGLPRLHPAGPWGPSRAGLPCPHPAGPRGPSRTGLPRPHTAGPRGPSHTGSSESTPRGAPGSQPHRVFRVHTPWGPRVPATQVFRVRTPRAPGVPAGVRLCSPPSGRDPGAAGLPPP